MFIEDKLENIHEQNEENKNPSTNMIYHQWFILADNLCTTSPSRVYKKNVFSKVLSWYEIN